MSKFRKLSDALMEIQSQVDALLPDGIPLEQALQPRVEAVFTRFEDDVWKELQKMVQKARPADPESRIYGEAMVTRILEAEAVAIGLHKRLSEARDKLAEAFGCEEDKQRQREAARRAEEARAAQEAERQRLAELERMRLEAEARERRLAELAAKEKQREEEERQRVLMERQEYEELLRYQELADQGNLRAVLEFVARRNDRAQYHRLLEVLRTVARNLKTEFSDPRFRHVRKENDTIRAAVGNSVGGDLCFRALGFINKQLQNPIPGVYFVLPEPDLVNDPEAYLFQMERFNGHHDQIMAAARAAGL